MPRLDDSTEALLHGGGEVTRRAKRFWSTFSDFALRDNVLEVAVGLILAAAFTTVVTSFISDIILPPISMLPFINKQLEEKFWVLRQGPHFDKGTTLGYNTLAQALADGAVVLAYGNFLDKLFSFLGVGIVLYSIAQLYQWLSSDTIIHETTRCRFCKKFISIKACSAIRNRTNSPGATMCKLYKLAGRAGDSLNCGN